MNIEQPALSSFVPPASDVDLQRLANARALHAAAVMLMSEGLEKEFHFFALNMRVAIVELEDQMGAFAPSSQRVAPLSSRPRLARSKPKMSENIAHLLRSKVD
jgi:hypothetical protein